MIAACSSFWSENKVLYITSDPQTMEAEIDFAVSINARATAGPVIISQQLKRQITLKEKYKKKISLIAILAAFQQDNIMSLQNNTIS